MPTILNAATELPDDSDETIRLGLLQARPPIPWGDSAIGTPSSSQFPSVSQNSTTMGHSTCLAQMNDLIRCETALTWLLVVLLPIY